MNTRTRLADAGPIFWIPTRAYFAGPKPGAPAIVV
jgi:hypothetical protein